MVIAHICGHKLVHKVNGTHDELEGYRAMQSERICRVCEKSAALMIRRDCLKCGKHFVARGKFHRRCEDCHEKYDGEKMPLRVAPCQ